jgi:hypothetical protein
MRLPYEVGILHYASDTPYTRGKNLGAGSLSYFGMDSTYTCSLAIVRRILEREILFLQDRLTHPLEDGSEQVQSRADAINRVPTLGQYP